MVIFTICCCQGNSLKYTHMNEKETPGVLLIFTANARGLNPKVKLIVYFQFFTILPVVDKFILLGATLTIIKIRRIRSFDAKAKMDKEKT